MKSLLQFRVFAAALPLLVVLGGCLSDPIDRPEVQPRVVTPPPAAWFFADNYQPPFTGDLVVRWNHAASDTQQNFKGYYIKLYTSRYDSLLNYDSLGVLIGTDSVLKVENKVDTSVIFHAIPMAEYSVVVFGIKFGDTLSLSRDSITAHAVFDPRPLLNPTSIRAASVNRHDVRLEWDVPVTDTNSGLKGYQVYYNEPDRLDSAKVGPLVAHLPGRSTLEATIGGLPELSIGTTLQPEHAFRFWVKAVRNDNVQFSSDTTTIVWAGAARVPLTEDSGGFRHSLIFGNYQEGLTLRDDSVDNQYQIGISIGSGVVTLTAANGAQFSTRVDSARSLDTIAYAQPIEDYSRTSLTLNASGSDVGGVIVYVSMPKSLAQTVEHARIWIKQQADGSFVTSRNGIYVQASYQTGVSLQGSYPYY